MKKFLPPAADLHLRQHARLALGVLLIYWPIRLYQNLPGWNGAVLLRELPFLLVEGLLIFGLLLGWVLLMDWLQGRLVSQRGGGWRLPPQWLTLLVAVGLGPALATFQHRRTGPVSSCGPVALERRTAAWR